MSCSPYYSLNLTTQEMETQLLSMTDLFNLENDSAKNYDPVFLTQSISVLNSLVGVVRSYPQLYDYPMLVDRLDAGPISSTEYADFLIATGTEQSTVEYINSSYQTYSTDGDPSYLSIDAVQYLDNMNTYYTDNFSSSITGGICAARTMFNSFLKDLETSFNSATQILGGIVSIQGLINQLIDTIKEKLLSIVNQLANQIDKCLGSVNNIANMIRDVKNFFSDLSIQSIKDTVSLAIADIANKFEIPDNQTDPAAAALQIGQAVDYLLYRLCQFTTAIENFLTAPVNAVKDALANCSQVSNVLTNVSNRFTLNALTAGAFRMSDSSVEAIKAQLGNELNGTPSSTLTASGADGSATPSNYWTTPFSAEENSIYVELVSATKDQLASESTRAQRYLQFQSQVLNQDDPFDAAGIKNLQASIVIVAIRIAKRLGTRLIINSGYRSPAYNAGLSGAAKNSYHMKGLALDCSRSAFGSDYISGENFIKAASQEGVGGIGTYPTFIHIDTGPRRSWSTIGGTSLGHGNARSLHQQDKFRNGL